MMHFVPVNLSTNESVDQEFEKVQVVDSEKHIRKIEEPRIFSKNISVTGSDINTIESDKVTQQLSQHQILQQPNFDQLLEHLADISDGDDDDEDEDPEQSVEIDEFGISNQDIDAVIAQALNSLSTNERKQALHDIHGVSDVQEEDPRVLMAKLNQLEIELSKIPNKRAYYMAKAVSPAYVCDPDFRMLFLRSDEMNPKEAAQRMVHHFDMKLQLFGPNVLGREILLSDLSAGDVQALASGYAQWIKQRDRAGRAVLCWTPGTQAGPLINRFRAQWFGMMNALRDHQTRKRGMVAVVISTGEKLGRFDVEGCLRLPLLSRSLPSRFVAVHTCSDKDHTRPVIDICLRALGTFHQVRHRSHKGTLSECLYSLMTFGIPSSAIPLNTDGSLKTAGHLQQLEKRAKQEREGNVNSKNVVFIPGPFDVLLGRGKLSQENLGNLRYRALIASYQERYEKARKVEKTALADEVIQTIKKYNGKFLTEYFADFIEISDAQAREKVSHSFRSLRVKAQHNVDAGSFIAQKKANGSRGKPKTHQSHNVEKRGRS